MVNYADGKIYKIVSPNHKKCYIGSTAEKQLCKRMEHHRSDYKIYLDGKRRYITSFEILEAGDATIMWLENVNCQSKDELRAKEQEWIDKTENCINKQKAFVTDDQRIEDNKVRCREYGKTHREGDKIRHKRYLEKTRDTINARARARYHTTKGNKKTQEQIDEINRKRREKYAKKKAAKEAAEATNI